MSFDTTQFREHGYQVFKEILPPDVVARVRRFLHAQMEGQIAALGPEIAAPTPDAVVQMAAQVAAEGPSAIQALSRSTWETLTGHFALQSRLARELWEIPQQPRFQALVRALIESERLYLHMPPTARFVLPGNVHAGVPAHQDISYNRHLSDFVVVWVPLVAIDDDCGGVLVCHGSGHVAEIPVSEERDLYWLNGVPTDGYETRHCKIGVGDVLALNKWVIHQSMPNISTRTRFSIDFRFFGERDRSTKHYLDLARLEVVPPSEVI